MSAYRSRSSTSIPPGVYFLNWDGDHVKITLDTLAEETDALALQLHLSNHTVGKYYSEFYMRCSGRSYMLFRGADGEDWSRKLMDVTPEGFWSSKSTYREAHRSRRETTMFKSSWWTGNRIMEDFEGNRYTWMWSDRSHLICIRSDDSHATVADFALRSFSLSEMASVDLKPLPVDELLTALGMQGKLKLEAAVSPDLLYLILCTAVIMYKELKSHRDGGW